MYLFAAILVLCFSSVSMAEVPSSQEIKTSTRQLEKDWNEVKREYKHKFKVQMEPIEVKIKELQNALDHGDSKRRVSINDEIRQMKILRDQVRTDFHEITVTSIVDLAAIQKHFINSKDDTKN
jgi:hypothetical protein